MGHVYTDSDEHAMLRQSAKEFLADAVPVAVRRAIADDGEPMPAALWDRLSRLGWTSVLLGDHGADLAAFPGLVLLAEESGRMLFPGPLAEANLGAALLASSRSTDPVLLDAIVSGSVTVAWCLAADVAGWSPPLGTGMTLRRTRTGYVLDGTAAFVRDVDQADVLLATVAGPDGFATARVDRSSPGVRVRTQRTLDVTRRFGTVEVSSLELADDAVTSASNGPLRMPLAVLNIARVLIAADCLGGCGAVLDSAVRYSKERVTFGRVIGSYQAIKHKLADMLVALETARVSVQYATQCVVEQTPESAARAVSIAKARACEAYSYLAGESLQIHGGIGFAWEHDCHLYIRRARTNEVLYGTPAWHFRQLGASVG